jgi:hypothetical protein
VRKTLFVVAALAGLAPALLAGSASAGLTLVNGADLGGLSLEGVILPEDAAAE